MDFKARIIEQIQNMEEIAGPERSDYILILTEVQKDIAQRLNNVRAISFDQFMTEFSTFIIDNSDLISDDFDHSMFAGWYGDFRSGKSFAEILEGIVEYINFNSKKAR